MFNTDQKIKIFPKVDNYISSDTIVIGTICSKDSMLRIDGEINGKTIDAKGIIIGEQGKVVADLNAKIVIIAGEVLGNIVASERIEISSKAKVFGDIESPVISIGEGSIFHGNCKMVKDKK